MKKYLFLCLLFSFFPLCAQDAEVKNLTEREFLSHVSGNAYEFIGNEEKLRQYEASYLQSRALLYPQIQGIVSDAYSNALYDLASSGLETKGQTTNFITPQLKVSQFIPTAGTLSLSAKDTVTSIEPGTFSGIPGASLIEGESSKSNTLDLSVDLNQPLYFKNAYKAAVDLLTKSHQNNLLRYAENKNALVVQALGDFYSLKQVLYNRQLVENRLAADRKTFARIELEYSMGLWTKSTMLNAQLALLKSEGDYLRIDNSFKESLSSFTAIYKLNSSPSLSAEIARLEAKPEFLAEVETSISMNNPTLASLSNSLRMLEANLVIFEKDNAPTLSAGLSYSQTTPFKKGDSESRSLSGSVGVSARLGDGGSYKNGKEAKKSEIESTRNSLSVTREKLLGQGRSLLSSLELSDKNRTYYTLLVEASSYEYEKGILDRELGQITDKQLTELKLSLENAKLALQQNIIEHNTAYLNLLSLMGKDLSELLIDSGI